MRLIAKFKLFIKGKLYFFELWNLTLLTPPPLPIMEFFIILFIFLNEGFPNTKISKIKSRFLFPIIHLTP